MTSNFVFKPITTEKSLSLHHLNQYSFWVPVTVTKGQVVSAFKFAFGFSPIRVQSDIKKGSKKTDWKKRRPIYQSNLKRVIITVPKDKKLDILTVKKS